MTPAPALTFLLSAFNRPTSLWMSLGSLINQTREDWECVILMNNPSPMIAFAHQDVVEAISDPRITLLNTSHPDRPEWDSYWAADFYLDSHPTAPWIAFPSDDTYYMPEFAATLLTHTPASDLVHCDMIFDARTMGTPARVLLRTSPQIGGIDKTGFIVRRSVWKGFQSKPSTPGPSVSDGATVEFLARSGARITHVPQPLAVHN